jgi:hypothetical protein
MNRNCRGIVCLVVAGLAASCADALADDTEELAKAAQNPIANMISLPFQNNTTLNVGPDDEELNVLNIQPVFPFKIAEDWNLITRTIVPVISQPSFGPGEDRTNGVGDTTFEAFFSPSKPAKVIWGIGPALVLPTQTDSRLGSKKWSAGPTLVALISEGHWLVGALANQVWSFSGPNDEADVSSMLIQPFINYNFKGGWYATTSPLITANWKARSNDVWTVPLGGGFGRIFKIGKQAMNGQLQAFYNVESPQQGGDWTIRAQFQLLFPK